MPTTNTPPSHLRPWSVIDDEKLKKIRRLVSLCQGIVDGFDPQDERYYLEIDSVTGGCTIEIAEMRDLLEDLDV